MKRWLGTLVIASGFATTTALFSQVATFDVASVRINRSGFPGGASSIRPGNFGAKNETLKQLIRVAYGLETFRIVGGPDWIDSDRFDIQARAAADAPRDQILLMLQSLLIERFRLNAHRETRELPVFELQSASRPGNRLRPAAAGACVEANEKPTNARLPRCGVLLAGPDRMSGRRVNLDLLAKELSPRVNRVVVNKAGRPEMFDIDLEWTPDDATREAVAALTPGGKVGSASPDGPGIFTALVEQLGLRLEPARGPVEVLVIDRAERPDEN